MPLASGIGATRDDVDYLRLGEHFLELAGGLTFLVPDFPGNALRSFEVLLDRYVALALGFRLGRRRRLGRASIPVYRRVRGRIRAKVRVIGDTVSVSVLPRQAVTEALADIGQVLDVDLPVSIGVRPLVRRGAVPRASDTMIRSAPSTAPSPSRSPGNSSAEAWTTRTRRRGIVSNPQASHLCLYAYLNIVSA